MKKLKREGGETLFGRKKSKDDSPKITYSITIMTDEEMDDQLYDEITDKIIEQAENAGIIGNISRQEYPPDRLAVLDRRFGQLYSGPVGYIVNEIKPEELEKRIKEMEDKHKWKKFFNLIPLTDYLNIEDEVVNNFAESLFYTEDLDRLIEFLNQRLEEDSSRTDTL